MLWHVVAAATACWVLWRLVVAPWLTLRYYAAQGLRTAQWFPFIGTLPHLLRTQATPYADRINLPVFNVPSAAWTPGLGHRIIIATSEAVKDVLVGSFTQLEQPSTIRAFLSPIMGNGLLLARGEAHRCHRRMLSPVFHYQNLQSMIFESTSACVAATVDHWLRSVAQSGSEVPWHRRMCELTLKVLGTAVLGGDLTRIPDSVLENFTPVLDVKHIMSIRGLIPGYASLPTARNRLAKQIRAQLDELVIELMAEARATKSAAGDCTLLQMLINARDDNGQPLSDLEIRDEAATFICAGHETTALLMTWTMVLLCQHPEWLQKVQAEVDSSLQGRRPQYEELSSMKLVNAVLMETLRMYPPIPALVRVATADCSVGGFHVLKDTVVAIPVFSLHYSNKYWSNPDTFDPSRWLNGTPCDPMAFLPFSYVAIALTPALTCTKPQSRTP